MLEDLDASFYDYTLETKESSFDAEAIGVSPIKKVSFRDKISYGRNKLKRIKVDIEEKVAQALDISAEELQPETQVENSKCNDLYKLVGLIKEKLLVSSRNEKFKLLTLTSESWTIEKTMKEFEVSKYLVKKARSLKKELGILAEPKAKTGKVLPQEMVTTVKDFYTNDEYSRMCTGKKECITVKVNDKKEKLQKGLLLLNIRELYPEFKKLNPNVKIGFSKFCELQPKQVVNVNSSGMHNTIRMLNYLQCHDH